MLKAIGRTFVNLVFLLIIAIAVLAAIGGGDDFEADMPDTSQNGTSQNETFEGEMSDPQTAEPERGETLPAPNPFDDRSIVEAEDAVNWSSGTGFAIASGGVWLTAKHVARGCDRLGILNENGETRVKAQALYISDIADVAIFQTEGGPTPLALDLDETDIKIGSRGFHVGYPQGKPGEVTSRLIGRELMLTRGAWQGKEDTLAWAETGRSDGLSGTLGGLSGGPAFDSKGNVIGITIAENPRRGRIVTTSAASIAAALSVAGIVPQGRPLDVSRNLMSSRTARKLRADLKVVQVICLTNN
jgi:serine protease Do